MQLRLLKYSFFCILSYLLACNNSKESSIGVIPKLIKDTSIRHAKRFSIASNELVTVVYIFGNKSNFDTTATYIIYRDSSSIKNIPNKFIPIKFPCKRIAALSSIYASMCVELGFLNYLVAIDNVDYFNNSDIISRCDNNQIKELAKGPEIDVERTINLNPDVVFTFGMGNPVKDINPKLIQAKIPVVISLDHLEETPLARAEWIKFFAAFTDTRVKADSIFSGVEKRYNDLKLVALNAVKKPTVFNEIKYSDAWYMPGGKSYVAAFLNDAHTNYLWQNDLSTGSIPLSFEQVYSKAKDAEFWINISTLKTCKEVLAFDERYSEFKAFKNGTMFNNTKHVNKHGYSNYWETGMIYPDRVLNDLILIFHPELKAKLQTEFYYYEKLK